MDYYPVETRHIWSISKDMTWISNIKIYVQLLEVSFFVRFCGGIVDHYC
jgi:hypothetical protein